MKKLIFGLVAALSVFISISAHAQINVGGGIFGTPTNPQFVTAVISGTGNLPLTINAVANDANIVFQESGNIKWYVRNLASDGGFSFYDNVNAAQHLLLNSNGANVPILNITTSASPASGAACTAGRIVWDASFIYVCTATGVWKRAALTGGY